MIFATKPTKNTSSDTGTGSSSGTADKEASSGPTAQDKARDLTKLSPKSMGAPGRLMFVSAGKGVSVFVEGPQTAHVGETLWADVTESNNPAALKGLASAKADYSALKATVDPYWSSPEVGTETVDAALGALAGSLGDVLRALTDPSTGTPTASWTNSDETPIEPGPDRKMGAMNIGQAAMFGSALALNAAGGAQAAGGQGSGPAPVGGGKIGGSGLF